MSKLSQNLDIAGSKTQSSILNVAYESRKLGRPISGQNGTSASISGTAPNIIVSGLLGMSSTSQCRDLTISNATNPANNGTFRISEYINSTSVAIYNESAIIPESGILGWIERQAYSLEDDLNYERSDRAAIKGVDYDEPVPQYIRPQNTGELINANLANIAGHTTDVKTFVINKTYRSITANPTNTYVTITDTLNLKHADAINLIGVPINDGYDVGNSKSTFCIILSNAEGRELTVLAGAYAGYRIYGRTRKGSSVSPNSVEVELRAVPIGASLSSSVSYTWESGQPNLIDIIIGYRQVLASIDDGEFREIMVSGILYGGAGSGGSLPPATELGQFLYSANGSTFTAEIPIVSGEGWILVDNQGKVVVMG